MVYFSTKINFILLYQNRMENHKTLVDVTPVQPAFQYRGKKWSIITGYNITYQSLTENDNGFVKASPNDRQANLTGLKEFVEYNISVVAFTVKGIGPPFVLDVRTDQDSKSYNNFFPYYYCNQCQRLFTCLFVFSG